ncbi:MAG TPA: hypothetical protein VEK57_16245 [Thermoanaerobaculia bacterium]|nr:hypothetical protein [Thermoanaerobaculia bacterium]
MEHAITQVRQQNAQQTKLIADLQKSVTDIRNTPPQVVRVQAPAPKPMVKKVAPKKPRAEEEGTAEKTQAVTERRFCSSAEILFSRHPERRVGGREGAKDLGDVERDSRIAPRDQASIGALFVVQILSLPHTRPPAAQDDGGGVVLLTEGLPLSGWRAR